MIRPVAPNVFWRGVAPVTAAAILLCCCAAKSDPKADDAAIRRTLATVAQRINQDDLAFVDIFDKDAVIIAPGAHDIAGFDAIRSMYAGLMEKTNMNVQFSTEEIVHIMKRQPDGSWKTWRMMVNSAEPEPANQ